MAEKSLDDSMDTSNDAGLILIVDDSESDIRLLERTITQSGVTNPLYSLRSGAEAIAYLSREGPYANAALYPYPRIIFLDLKMPPPDGLAVLRWKATERLPKMLCVVLSNLDDLKTIKAAYQAGASTFLSKPLRSEDVANLIQTFREYWIPGHTIEIH